MSDANRDDETASLREVRRHMANGGAKLGSELLDELRADRSDVRASTTRHAIDPKGVNHPSHYNAHPAGIECIDVIEHMTHNVGAAMKYLWRAGLKGDDAVKDLRKAAWYATREAERIEKLRTQPDDRRPPPTRVPGGSR